MMKRIVGLTLFAFTLSTLVAQDTIVDRNVTIEREFQPIIQDAGKVQTAPSVFVPTLPKQTIQYTDFARPLVLDPTFHTLDKAAVQFGQTDDHRGFFRAGLGVWNTLGDFSYDFLRSKKSRLGFTLGHSGVFVDKKYATTLGSLDFNTLFDHLDLYAGVEANHRYFNYYGQAYDASSMTYVDSLMAKVNGQHLWDVRTKLGIRSLPDSKFNYKLQTGYEYFALQGGLLEHQVRTEALLDWNINKHMVGLDFSMQNLFYAQLPTLPMNQSNTLLHLEPFYAWRGDNFNIHAGVNLDFSTHIGKTFLPSPNVYFDWDIRDAVVLYGGIQGDYHTHTAQTIYAANRYINPTIVNTDAMAYYKPIDATLGFRFRPQTNLQFNLFASYSYVVDNNFYVYDEFTSLFDVLRTDAQHVEAGLEADYHYRDIFKMGASCTYNYWQTPVYGHAFDHPAWEGDVNLRLKVIDRLYFHADAYWASQRNALVRNPAGDCRTETLKSIYDVNLGASYEFNKHLSLFATFNNIINRRYEQFYAYQVQGFNFLVGVTFGF